LFFLHDVPPNNLELLQVLGYLQRSLGSLLARFCGLTADKALGQRADWRQRWAAASHLCLRLASSACLSGVCSGTFSTLLRLFTSPCSASMER
jgi:hypothetical protein